MEIAVIIVFAAVIGAALLLGFGILLWITFRRKKRK
jgi:hypothetical protein